MNLYINKKLAEEKGLISNDKISIYDKLENYYKYLFEKYLITKIDFKKYRDLFNNSELEFKPAKVINPTLNDLNEYFKFDYIYLMNNFFIEKLSLEDINLLENSIDENSASKEILELIENTYKDIIKNNYIKNEYTDETYNIVYGKSTPDNFARNDSIIFKIYYSVVDKNETKEEFLSRYDAVMKFITDIQESLKKEVEEQLKVNCDVLVELK